jgi:ADP-ribose pyrophosphatase YjhB (NUDIX family)
MDKEFSYCPMCGSILEAVDESGHRRMKCGNCGFIQYLNPSSAVGVIVRTEEGVLLVKRRFEPYKGKWVIPSGFIEYDEDMREAAVRETLEETGLEVELTGLHAAESCFDDPRGNTILVLFDGKITGGVLEPGDDADGAAIFPLDRLPEIAFEAHRKVLSELS